MDYRRLNLFFYSPTHTSQKIINSIATGIGIDPLKVIENNLTYPGYSDALVEVEAEDLVIIAAPVYAGQIAIEAEKRLSEIKFAGNPCVLVAVYGNRHYDDALICLREMAIKAGLHPIAATAFVGEHSYSTRDFPIAKGRPDAEDKIAAENFGKQIKEKMQNLNADFAKIDLNLPGTYPLPERRTIRDSHTETAPNKCIKCGECQTACPTGAIYFKNGYKTVAELCTVCCACVKVCKRRARIIISEHVPKFRTMLFEKCSERKEPEIFI
jgi:ferredoxin